MLVKTYCAAVNGLEVTTVTCEVSMSSGMQFHLSGLADTAVKESYDRIKAAFVNNALRMPSTSRLPTSGRREAATTCPWRLAFWPQAKWWRRDG